MKRAITRFVFLIHLFAFSQESNFNNFIHFSVSEGLSQSTVVAIEQDQFDRMWIGTRDGINKHDGEEITIYRSNPADSTSISNNDILSIKEDKDGFVWVGTYNGLNKFNPRTETFTRFLYSSKKNTNSHRSIRTIREMADGTLWFATSDGLFIYDKKEEDLIRYGKDENDITSLSSDFIIEIFQDKEKKVWIGTSSGLHQVTNDDIYNLKFKRYGLDHETLPKLFIQSLNEDSDGNIWIGTRGNGLFLFNKKNETFIKYNEVGKNKISSSDIRRLVYDYNSNLWIGTYDGLFIKKVNNEIIKIVNQPGNPKSISKNSIKEIFTDRNGSVWIGTYYGGANLWDIHNNNFHTLYRTKRDQAYHLGVVSSIAEDSKGIIYLGTEGSGVTVIHNNGKTCNELTEALNKKLSNANVKSLLIDDQKLWIGTLKDGVKCFDITTKSFLEINNPELKNLLSDKRVYTIKKIKNQLVFGTFGAGAIVYNLTTKEISSIQHHISDFNSLTNDRIRCMISDLQSNLWIGTDKGINKISFDQLSSEDKVIERFLFENEKSYGHNIICIYENHVGEIFVGTKERGVFKLVNGSFEQLDLELLNTRVTAAYSIVEDNQDNLWISSNLGLVKYQPKTKNTTIYTQTEGFLGNEFINNSYLKGSNGNLYFGGVKGAYFFNPKELKRSDYISKVVLTSLQLNGKELDKSISFMDQLVLEHDEASFTLNFAIPNYINAANNRYAYRLVGLNADWKFTNSHEASYTIQKPGNYIFQVKDANNPDAWNEEPTSLKIKVKAALWKTPLAFVIYILIIVFVLYQIYRNMRAKIILGQKLKSERLENIRQEEINKSKLEFFTNISHDFRTPLTLIIAPLQQLIENYSGNKATYMKLLTIKRNSDQLLKLTNQVLDFRAFENKHSKLQAREENLVSFLEEIYKSFEEYASIGNYQYSITYDSKEIPIFYDQSKLEKVFYNILSNAFKYTPRGGTVKVKLYRKNDHAIIEISDNGRGIKKEFIDKIFDRYYEIASDVEYQKQFNQGSGIGLHIAKKVIDLHKGAIEVKSDEGNGTTFTITLKTGRNHLKDHEILFTDTTKAENFDDNKQEYLNEALRIIELDKIIPNIDSNKPKILVVEDNDEFRKFIVDILKKHYTVEQAENGEEGFKKTLRVFPDLIISDVIMPKMEGTEFCSKIKNDHRTSHIPIILLTSRSSMPHKFDGLESGADAYIDKPFNIKELLLIIKNLLSTTEKVKNKFAETNSENVNNTIDSIDENLQRKAVKIIENNIDNPSFDIPYFSSELGLSRTMLFVKVKAWTNLTPKEFINSIRMKKATELLELGELSVAEVGYKVGFKDPKYFSKCFKKYYQKSPSEYAQTFYS
ncbi:two-component regulator propeller domain-containing protein [Aquimarina sp. MMG016]|uniref:two-component regulator propeller domain-containing protein n=1 Tax=Aquimarina sp. MMG016 TaxID=2822690 RepID=UPI001B3A617B|nr:two-component regulator propeller domain-containing protein [Aquimarina sp. MMG016]MBQ4819520.1 response regulator [Aquimarina sp. MMG016]